MKPYYHRKLPHWIPPGAIFFITFRLANSLPQPILQALKEERERERQAILAQWDGAQQRAALYTLDKTFFGQYDAWLDRCLEASPRWLADEQVARLARSAIRPGCLLHHAQPCPLAHRYREIREEANTSRRHSTLPAHRPPQANQRPNGSLLQSAPEAFWVLLAT